MKMILNLALKLRLNTCKAIAAASAVCLFALTAHAGTVEPLQPAKPAQAFPGDSVYQLPITLENQQGNKFKLASQAGHIVITSMFYNSCEYVCPMLIDTIRMLEKKLDEKEKSHLSILLVTLDPARDDIATLQSIAKTRELDTQHWLLARTSEKSVRQLAAVLNIQYRQMENGEFNHTSALILLDTNGRILARSSTLGTVDDEFLKTIKSALKNQDANSTQ
ncbi:SCO family protein [Undibacterium sp. Ji50W]|uniref:SCO family protein n=1 Tax=Undibacterium sp. Ji50W TaxID=3413041 RepID=UPI003BF0D685